MAADFFVESVQIDLKYLYEVIVTGIFRCFLPKR